MVREFIECCSLNGEFNMKFLFIDDNGSWLVSVARALRANQNVACVECHSVEGALSAVALHQPEVIFLDHHLTETGDEGFQIADSVIAMGGSVKICSTTSDTYLSAQYRKRGIEMVGKTDLRGFRAIINQ